MSMVNSEKVVVVTGALGGIGSAIVARYLNDGMKVGLLDFDAAAGAKKAAALREEGHQVFFACADVSDFAQCEAACREIEQALGPVYALVLNAGISPKKDGKKAPIYEMDEDEWRRVVGVNLDGAFNLCRIVSPGMVQRRSGRIVTMSSVAGKSFLDLVGVHYSATKGALIAFTRHLAGELGPYGITVNGLAPGRIDTPLLKTVSVELNEAVIADTPLRRLGTPGEVAAACAFFTSDDAGFITGQVLDVAGGWLMT
jgi:3-oxoacyl-[acyl-carrier protein] reductase